MKILFITHKIKSCGVYQWGYNISQAMQKSTNLNWEYFECDSYFNMLSKVNTYQPDAILINFHPGTLPWFNENFNEIKLYCNSLRIPLCGTFHEVTQAKIDANDHLWFDFTLCLDPTLKLNNFKYFKLPRLILNSSKYLKSREKNTRLTISSFGFPFSDKGFVEILNKVNTEFDNAIIKFNLPNNNAVDENRKIDAKQVLAVLSAFKLKPNIELQINRNFLNTEDILSFLSDSHLNCFFYTTLQDRGISSCIDYALGAKVPIAITESNMFRHLLHKKQLLCIEHNKLKDIIDRGIAPLEEFYNKWSAEQFVSTVETIFNNILLKFNKNYE